MDFADHDRPDTGAGVGRSVGPRDLQRKLLFAYTVRVSTKAHPVLRGPEAEAMAVAGQQRARVRAEEVHVVAERTEAEADAGAGHRIEVIFGEQRKSAGRQGRSVGNAEFPWERWIIAQIPAADIHAGGADVEQFDNVLERQRGAAQDLVDHHPADGGYPAVYAWCAQDSGAGVVSAIRSADERKPEAICGHWPGRAVAIRHGNDLAGRRVANCKSLTVVVKLAGIDTVDRPVRIAGR